MKNLIFISCLLLAFGSKAQDLKLTKGNKSKIITIGTSLELKYVHESCIECNPRRLTGELIEVTADSLSFFVKSQVLYSKEGNLITRKDYNFKELNIPLSIAKKDIRIMRKTDWTKWRLGSGIAAGLTTISSISTIINSQVVTNKESRSKLEELALIQTGVAAVLFTVSSINPKLEIGKDESAWKID